MIRKCSNAVCERIGCYIHILKDPRNDTIFYVGKGRKNRVFQHVQCALKNVTQNDRYDYCR